jgi:hypothetical protein
MSAIPSDPLAALVHLRIEQLRREADDHRLVREARRGRAAVPSRRTASSWPTAVVAAVRDSLSGRPLSPAAPERAGADHAPTVCCA